MQYDFVHKTVERRRKQSVSRYNLVLEKICSRKTFVSSSNGRGNKREKHTLVMMEFSVKDSSLSLFIGFGGGIKIYSRGICAQKEKLYVC